MNDVIKKSFWYLVILTLGLSIVISGCKKKDKDPDATEPAPIADTTLQGVFATELKTDLIAAGLPEGQAGLISSGALLEADQVLGVSASVRAISKSAVILVAPAIAQGAMKNINDASVNEDKRKEIAGVIARSVIKSLNGRTGVMDVDKLVVLFKDVSGGAIGNMDDGGITDMQDTIKEVMFKFVGSLGESGLPSEDLSVAIKNLNAGAVGGLEKAGLTGQDKIDAVGNVTGGSISALGEIDTAGFKVAIAAKAVASGATGGLEKAGFNPSELEPVLIELNSKAVIELKNVKGIDAATKTLAIGNIASGSVGGLGEIKGLTAEQIASSSKFITEGITESLVEAEVPAADMAEVIVNTTSFAVKALDDAGLPKLYIKNAALGMLDSTFRSLSDAGITDTDTDAVLADIKIGIKASLDRLDVLKLDSDMLDAAKAAIDAYGTKAYVDPFQDSLVCSETNLSGCDLATCSNQREAACGLVTGCTWDKLTDICKEEADVFVCPADSAGTYPDCVCKSGIFDKATNTCVAADVNCPTNAIKGTTAPDCACEAPIEYDPVTNTCGGNACPTGSTGDFPNCVCKKGVFDADTLACVEALCPADAKGTYPDCECGVGAYDSGANVCLTDTATCPLDASGTYPDCVCGAGYTYDGVTNTCLVNEQCPADAIKGDYAPDCACDSDAGYSYDIASNTCLLPCPANAIKGDYAPDCACDSDAGYSYDVTNNACLLLSCPPDAIDGLNAPDCKCDDVAGYSYDTASNTCLLRCPADAIKGDYAPDCACDSDAGYSYDTTSNTCLLRCPSDAKGDYAPDCACDSDAGYSYDIASNACLLPSCPADAIDGVYAPDCKCEYEYDAINNVCLTPCPADAIDGVYAPDCKCDPNELYPFNVEYNVEINECVPLCPTDSKGTYPNCDCGTGSFDPYSNTCGVCPDTYPGTFPGCVCSVKGEIYLLPYGDPKGECGTPPVCDEKREVATQNYPYCECTPEYLDLGYIYVDGKGCVLP